MKNLGAKILLLITILVTLLVIHSTRERRSDPAIPTESPAQQAPRIPAQGFGTGSKSITQPALIRGPWEKTASENHHFPSIQERGPLFPGVFPA